MNRLLKLDTDTISSTELAVKHLDRLAKTFHEICTDLGTQILLLSGKINSFFILSKNNIFITI